MSEELFPENSGRMKVVFSGEVPISEIEAENVVMPSKAFLKSVKTYGVIQPIALMKSDDEDLLPYILIAGRRRLKACVELEIEKIPAVVYEIPPGFSYGMTLVENSERETNPVAEYRAIKDLVNLGASAEQITKATGMGKSTIEKRLRFDKLPNTILDAVENGDVAKSTAEGMVSMSEAQIDALVTMLVNKGTITSKDVSDLKSAVKRDEVETLPDELFEPQKEYDEPDAFELWAEFCKEFELLVGKPDDLIGLFGAFGDALEHYQMNPPQVEKAKDE